MKKRQILFVPVLFLALCFASISAIARDDNDEIKPCSQSKAEKLKLIKEAQANEFNLRRTEVTGNTYTRMRTLMKHAAFYEGDIFTQARLMKNIRGFSKVKEIYSLSLDDVKIRLDREFKDVDILFCVKQKERK